MGALIPDVAGPSWLTVPPADSWRLAQPRPPTTSVAPRAPLPPGHTASPAASWLHARHRCPPSPSPAPPPRSDDPGRCYQCKGDDTSFCLKCAWARLIRKLRMALEPACGPLLHAAQPAVHCLHAAHRQRFTCRAPSPAAWPAERRRRLVGRVRGWLLRHQERQVQGVVSPCPVRTHAPRVPKLRPWAAAVRCAAGAVLPPPSWQLQAPPASLPPLDETPAPALCCPVRSDAGPRRAALLAGASALPALLPSTPARPAPSVCPTRPAQPPEELHGLREPDGQVHHVHHRHGE